MKILIKSDKSLRDITLVSFEFSLDFLKINAL